MTSPEHVAEAMYTVLKERTDLSYDRLRVIVEEQLYAMTHARQIMRGHDMVGMKYSEDDLEKQKLLRIVAALND